MGNNAVAADELRLLIERIERLEEEKKAIAGDIKSVYGEAKARGFDAKTMRSIVSLRKLDENARRKREALLDLYKAALGMLDGTPLGTWAVEKLKKDETSKRSDPKADVADAVDSVEPIAPEPLPPELTVDDAKRLGGEAARAGKPVTANPFPPRDSRRAAWDEAWCRELGTDGMDIPEALRPAGRKPKAETPDPAAFVDEAKIDPLYGQAVEAVQSHQKASVSWLQRHLKIGFNQASALLEQMQRDGLVSAPNNVGRREVLVDEQGRPK